MTYSVDKFIPQAYCEKFATVRVLAETDCPVFVNAMNIFDCKVVSDEVPDSITGNCAAPSITEDYTTNPEVVVMFGHVFPIEDGVYSATIGTPRVELIDYIESMLSFLRLGDANTAFSVMTLISNSIKNIVSENLTPVKRKPMSYGEITPCSL